MPTIMEQLLSTMTDEEKSVIRKKLAENPQIIADDSESSKLLAIYRGEEETPEQKAAREKADRDAAAARQAEADRIARETAAKAASSAGAGAGGGDSAGIAAELRRLSETITAQQSSFNDFKSKVITTDQLPKLGADLTKNVLALAIERADEVSTIRETHRREFGEELDRTKFEEFAKAGEDPTTHVNKYRSITDAYNAYVGERRIQAKIDKGVADGVKQKLSGQEVPGSTQQVALSPAQQVMKKAAESANKDGKSNAMVAAERLKQIARQREESATVN